MSQETQQQQPTPKERHLMAVIENMKAEIGHAAAVRADLAAALQAMKEHAQQLEEENAQLKEAAGNDGG